MLKLTYLSLLLLVILVSQESVAKSQNNGRSTCLLQDPQNQCGDFCLSKIHPMIELVPETNSKLKKVLGEQQSIQMKLVAVQSTVEAQRISMQNSLNDITTKEEFGAKLGDTKEKLMAVIFELKNQLQLQSTKMEDQDTAMQTKLIGLNSELKSQLQYLQTNLESLQRTITKNFAERLNVTEEQLLVSNSELKTQLKEMDTNVRDQDISMQTKLDAQLLAVQKKLEDQNTALSESFEARLNGTEVKMEAQLKELQNKTENQLAVLENQLSALQKTLLETHSALYHKFFYPKFERYGSRYFYFEHTIRKPFDEAAAACRGMGGYLAAFKTQEELEAISIKPEVEIGYYWTGIKLNMYDEFISTASGKPASVFMWNLGEPDHDGECIAMVYGEMSDFDCHHYNNFICQSDNEI
ncbi:RB1-inducible coiled-coil protein 1-like [Drosophila takahashii]|uniref:RB1-inducible coiled-coil protein 1-like n=1 Tax=Drosophila takahashii TaxID=29030 RepID=UPI001CF8DB80|nr:GRIP domain-containing protein RUD3-like [Drosophila takahashii]